LIGAPTPNIDTLASGGLKLYSTYSQPTRTLTRAAIMTGRIPTRSGLTRPLLAGVRVQLNPWADEVTAARLLSGAGYQTALSGKWHLGEAEGLYPHQVGYAGKSPAGFPHRDVLVEVDDIVGRVMQVLRETGQEANTLVFFTSDNDGNEDLWPDSSYQPCRGGKSTAWEGGVRVPGMAHWTGMIKGGRMSDGL
jgi:arylsulfatase A-like enzyme